MQLNTIKQTRTNDVLTVSLNRPDVRNAFNPEVIGDLTTLFSTSINKDPKLRAVVLRGEGKSFCAGAYLVCLLSLVNFTLSEKLHDSENLFKMFQAMRDCPIPLLGLVHGHAMGGALGLIAVCDMVAAEAGTLFSFSEAKLGLAPAVISPFVLEKMRTSCAHRYMLTAEVFSAEAAQQAGLIQFAGSMQDAESFIAKQIELIHENGPEAVRVTKSLLRLNAKPIDWAQVMTETTRAIAERRVSSEGQEGLKSFFAKKSPGWRVKP